MTREQFRQIDKHMREVKQKIFRLSDSDERVSEDKVVDVERLIGIVLPTSYRQFLMDYGGGDFGLVTIFSADAKGKWYLPDRLADIKLIRLIGSESKGTTFSADILRRIRSTTGMSTDVYMVKNLDFPE